MPLYQTHYDLNTNFINDSNFSMSTDEILGESAYGYPVKMKAGVTTLTTTGLGSVITGIDRGLGAGVQRNSTSGQPCGQYVTIYFSTKNYTETSFTIGTSSGISLFSAFFSQFETVYKPLPWFIQSTASTIAAPIIITSPNFTAPNGLFTNGGHGYLPPNFAQDPGTPNRKISTFKVAPKIFSDETMASFTVYPPYNGSYKDTEDAWEPFKDCPVESIAYQGTFSERLEHIGPCNFTFYDNEGFANLSGYPSGGSPKTINHFIQASKARLSTTFPKFSSDRLESSINHFTINEVIIDAVGTPELPFGGIDFKEAQSMNHLYLTNPKWIIDLPLQNPDDMNFTFNWATLGVSMPQSLKESINTHILWQNNSKPEKPCHIATPTYLKTKLHYTWGTRLETIEPTIEKTIDYMPLTPTGLEKTTGYYRKFIIGEYMKVIEFPAGVYNFKSEDYEKPRFGSWAMPSVLDGTPHTITPQPIPEGVTLVNSYCMNLYSDLELDTPITLPKLPSSVTYTRDCYRRTFYNTVGPIDKISTKVQEPVIMLAYSQSSDAGTPEVKIIANLTPAYLGEFRYFYNDATSRSIKSYLGQDQVGTTIETGSSLNSWLLELLQEGEIGYKTRVIKQSVTLEKSSLPNLTYSGGWQKECFFGSGIRPDVEDLVLPITQVNEWDTYGLGLNIDLGTSFSTLDQTHYKGQLWWTDNSNPLAPRNYVINFLLMLSYGYYDPTSLQEYKLQLDELIFNGSPRTESSTVIKPYENFLSTSTVNGTPSDFLNFQTSHGILKNTPGNFTGGTGSSISEFYGITGVPMGFNVHWLTVPGSGWSTKRVEFKASYTRNSGPRTMNEDLKGDPNNPNTYFFNPPAWIDSQSARNNTQNTEYSFYQSQSSLDQTVHEINDK